MMTFWKMSAVRFSSVCRPRVPAATRSAGVRAGAALALLAVAVVACGGGPGSSSAKPDDDTADNTNTCTTDDMFVELPARSAPLEQAESLEAVTWTVGPKIQAPDELVATGTLEPGVALFNPLRGYDRDSPAFSVYYVGNVEALVELVPDLPDGQCWKTTATIAPTEVGTPEGAGDRGFTITASSPLFRDVAGAEWELRVWGTDADGNEALLSKVSIATE